MERVNALNEQIKILMVENLMLKISPAEIPDDQALFGPNSLGLDSVDALELVLALEKEFGVKIGSSEESRQALATVNSLAEFIRAHQAKK